MKYIITYILLVLLLVNCNDKNDDKNHVSGSSMVSISNLSIGNDLYMNGDLNNALKYYNKALLEDSLNAIVNKKTNI